ncbi:phosphonate ABC transporter ATP-binding protein [Paenibacillus assamensis]|uniref:phosphonate ABC transporter ATP-binding protein n=1 Tax=Paenibacillus assamensis TaxID=311244 RepID=UPI0003FAA529|nr:ATP-binding cassette domain-containing protein [Paenibacillus assamensis]
MLKIENLSKVYPPSETALQQIDIEIEKGQFVGVVGSSGSGKSTLLKCLAMQQTWTSGTYRIGDHNITVQGWSGRRKIRRECAYLEQTPVLNVNRKALKNVLIGRSQQTPLWRMMTGMVRNDDYMGAMDTLERLGLLDKAHMLTSELSGGERQRIAIARALVHGAQVLLVDEPVLGLDPKSAESVMNTLRELALKEQVTVVAVLHQVELAEKYATRVIGLANGRIEVDVMGRRLLQTEKQRLSIT